MNNNIINHRLSLKEKESDNFKYFKDNADILDKLSVSSITDFSFNGDSNKYNLKINYDLYNGIINKEDFEKVCKQYGIIKGNLPDDIANRDIISPKIKSIEGLYNKRPFIWKAIATNEEATTRKEQEEFGMIKDYVMSLIMKPLREEIELSKYQQLQGKEPSPEDRQRIVKEVEQELKTRTPFEVRKHMEREYQDVAERQMNQILEYLIQEQDIKYKFQKGTKHASISAHEIYWTGIRYGKPCLETVNPLYFYFDRTQNEDFTEDTDWAVRELHWTPSKVIAEFGDELTDTQIDEVQRLAITGTLDNWTFSDNHTSSENTVSVRHCVWKGLRKIGFLQYIDENGVPQEMMVDETYKLNKERGDISVQWKWIPITHETYKIGADIYVRMGIIPGQHRDLDNLYECKLPYSGGTYDALNSKPTSFIDRTKYYQYFYDIIFYTLEELLASDKGKWLMLNANLIPKSMGIDLEKWMHYANLMKVGFFNPNEEGNRNRTADVTNAVKVADMSLASDIQKYIMLLDFIDNQTGRVISRPRETEGMISASQSVGNVKNINQATSDSLEPFFSTSDHIKRNALQNLCEVAKVVYRNQDKKCLTYVLDDGTKKSLKIDAALLDSSTLGIFVANSFKAHEAKQLVENLAHAGMQTQTIDLSDILRVINTDDIGEAQDILRAAETKKKEELHAQNLQVEEARRKTELAKQEGEMKKMEFDRETKVIVENIKTEREIQKQAMLSMGFNENKDIDRDGKLDVLEVAKQGVDVGIKQRKQNLDEQKFKHQQQVDKEKLRLEQEKNKKLNKS
jgi:hypothetical protein